MTKTERNFDLAIIGAGFAGALTSLCLQQMGYKIILIEKDSHPRFAIGESSTPIANLILRDLSERFNLPWLRDLSHYGSWQETHPDVACGLKRGFSYYKHESRQPFKTNALHANKLLVAASANDQQSDTNWYRSDVDAYFVEKVKEAGITYWDNTQVSNLKRHGNRWKIVAEQSGQKFTFSSHWLIDATGSDAILKMLNVSRSSNHFRTNSSAVFSHFKEVEPWQYYLHHNNISTTGYPYNPDHSALHHLLEEGWLWMLRFNNGITSAGLVFNGHKKQQLPDEKHKLWKATIDKYPSLKTLFRNAEIAPSPGRFIQTHRLQRRAEKLTGDGWIALPHTAGFIDPLHSTGIAHSLSGIERILHILKSSLESPKKIHQKLDSYEQAIFQELDFIDMLIDGCYRTMDHFELFNIYSMLYFTAAIHYEQNRIGGGFDIDKHGFLSADNTQIRQFTERFYGDIRVLLGQKSINQKDIQNFREAVAEAIKPYNIAGLLNPDVPNMYHHTAAEF